jgi:beta-lactamase class A
MISRSDNTATDHLIDLVGRGYLEEIAGPDNTPFLKTVELFNLKYGVDQATRDKYLSGNLETKREVLDRAEELEVSEAQVTSEPTLIEELEWFFSTEELASVIYALRNAREVFINPGLANKSDWYRVGYKGGSEGGVLQYTHLLRKSAGSPVYVISLTVNNTENSIDNTTVTNVASRLIDLVKSEKI